MLQAIPLLHEAVNRGDAIAIRRLLATETVNVNALYQGWSALYCAAFNGHVDCVKELIANGANINDQNNFLHRTPLHAAAGEGHLACVKELAQKWTIEIDAQDSNGWTPLHWAAWFGHVACIEFLVDNGALIGNAADLATEKKFHDIADYLKIQEKKRLKNQPESEEKPS